MVASACIGDGCPSAAFALADHAAVANRKAMNAFLPDDVIGKKPLGTQ
jgi:hypothetical protein